MKHLIYIILILIASVSIVTAQDKVMIRSEPSKIYVEVGENKQYLNVDFIIQNNSDDTLTLSSVIVSVLDKNKTILHQRFLDGNGTAPSIQTIPNRTFNGKEAKLVFNPFSEFNLDLPLNELEFQFVFSDNEEEEYRVKTVVLPKKYIQKVNYVFPLNGRVLIYDAHDQYAHHRRFDYIFEPIAQLGITSNFMRYAYDFVLLDDRNNRYTGNKADDMNYIGFGKSVYAVADGKVIYTSNDHKDDKTFDYAKIKKNALELYGNCVAILHADGSISIYGHLKENSLKVKVGDQVLAKQEIANIGISGSSFFPHLHFEIRTSLSNSSEGLPSYFSNVYDSLTKKKIGSGLVETGNIISTK